MGAESFNAEGFEDQLDHVLSYGKIYCSNCKKESPDYDYSCINCGSLNTDAGNPEQSHMMQGYWIDGDNSPELYEAETFEAKVYDPMMQKKIDKNECKHRYDDGEDAWVMKYSELLGVEDGLSYVEAGVKCEICSQERIGSWGINEKEGFQITKGDEGRIPKWSIGFYGAETFEAEHYILKNEDDEIIIQMTDDWATIDNAKEIIDNLVDKHGFDDEYDYKDLTIYFHDIEGNTLRTLSYNVRGNEANNAIIEWFSDYDYPVGGYTAEFNAEGKKRSGLLSEPFEGTSLDSGEWKGILTGFGIGLLGLFGYSKLRK
jgi:hypothetical protein